MNGMLKMDPDERMTAIECLAHPYFDGIRDEEVQKLVNAYNSSTVNRRESSKSRGSLRT